MQTALAKQSPQPNNVSLINSESLISSALIKLARWNPSETLPAGLSSTSLAQAIDGQRNLLRPATDYEITSAVSALVTHAAATGITCGPVASVKAVWATHCRDMPAVLLAKHLPEILKRWTNTFCLPAPGALWEAVDAELAQMRRDLATLQNAERITGLDAYDPADRAPSAETDAILAKTLAALKTASGSRRRVA